MRFHEQRILVVERLAQRRVILLLCRRRQIGAYDDAGVARVLTDHAPAIPCW